MSYKQLLTQYGNEFGQWLYNISIGYDNTEIEQSGRMLKI